MYIRPLPALLPISAAPAPPPGEVKAVVSTEMGAFRFELAREKAPAREQFIKRAREGDYDGSASTA